MKRLTIILIFLLVQFVVVAQTKVSNLDLSYRYNNSNSPTGKILCTIEDSTATLLVRIDQSLDSLRRYGLSYSLANSLEESIKAKYQLSPISSYFQYEDESGAYFGMKIRVLAYRYVILWLEDKDRYLSYPLIKDIKTNRNSGEITMTRLNFNVPIISNHIKLNSSVRLRPLDGAQRNLTVKYYDYNFMPALPPMSSIEEAQEDKLTVDEEYNLTTDDTLSFASTGLYYFEFNGAQMGQSVVVTDAQYPGTNSFDELVRNLRYLTTEDEYEKMSTSFEKKELFDKFWLNNTKSEDKAREAVREYYQRVRTANELFTSYKEGWKTDRGMLFIIFGPPNRVFVSDEAEMWIYEKSFELPRVSFIFSRINTAFTEEHYVLRRNAEYQNLWYRVVDLWRKGKKEY